MRSDRRRAITRRLGVFAVVVVTVLGAGTAASAAPAFPHLHRVAVSSKRVHPGGTFTIVARARYRVVEDYGVTFFFDLSKVDLVDESCTDVNGPQNADTPSCEYDNRFRVTTTTKGVFRVSPGGSGSISVLVCAKSLVSDGRSDCKVRRVRVA